MSLNLDWFYSPERESFINQKLDLHNKEICFHYGKKSVLAVMLYGSQNYGLDTSKSDVDTKTILLPSFRDVVLGKKMVSTDFTLSDSSLSNVKDIREMFKNYLKGNINFVETLFTNYYRVNEDFEEYFEMLRGKADLIANTQPVKLIHMAAGMATQKYVAFEKPFESKKKILAKYGYNPKQLHHLLRLNEFIKTYTNTCSFRDSLMPSNREYLTLLKTEPLPYDEAVKLKEETYTDIQKQVTNVEKHLPEKNNFEEAKLFLDEFTIDVFESQMESKFFRR